MLREATSDTQQLAAGIRSALGMDLRLEIPRRRGLLSDHRENLDGCRRSGLGRSTSIKKVARTQNRCRLAGGGCRLSDRCSKLTGPPIDGRNCRTPDHLTGTATATLRHRLAWRRFVPRGEVSCASRSQPAADSRRCVAPLTRRRGVHLPAWVCSSRYWPVCSPSARAIRSKPSMLASAAFPSFVVLIIVASILR